MRVIFKYLLNMNLICIILTYLIKKDFIDLKKIKKSKDLTVIISSKKVRKKKKWFSIFLCGLILTMLNVFKSFNLYQNKFMLAVS